MSTLYVSGAMSGKPQFNFPLFDEVARAGRVMGHHMISPADHDRASARKAGVHDITKVAGYAEGDVECYSTALSTLNTEQLLGWDFKQIIEKADGIVMLPGWEQSTGARYERIIAEATGKEVLLAKRVQVPPEIFGWVFEPDEKAKRVSDYLRDYPVSTAPLATHGVIGLPVDAADRKAVPIASGVLDYFPNALAEVARVSKAGNDQHHPGEPLHWDKSKSTDESDALIRHFMERGTIDSDGMRHSAKVAWRALALLQRELEEG